MFHYSQATNRILACNFLRCKTRLGMFLLPQRSTPLPKLKGKAAPLILEASVGLSVVLIMTGKVQEKILQWLGAPSPTAQHVKGMDTTKTASNNACAGVSTKRNQPPMKLPNQDLRKKQQSFLKMRFKNRLETKVAAMGMELNFLDPAENNLPPTMNRTNPPPQPCLITAFPLRESP